MAGYAETTGGGPGAAVAEALISIINRITEAAKQATTQQSNCQNLASHLNIIGTLLPKVPSTADITTSPAAADFPPLFGLELALDKALHLVESCRDRSHLYMVAVGWGAMYQFRQVQTEIDACVIGLLRPLISLAGLEENLKELEEDATEFTLDEDEFATQIVLQKHGRTIEDARVLEATLRRRYPDLEFDEALKIEREKLRFLLQRLQIDENPSHEHCRLIQHLINVTDNVVNLLPEKMLHSNALAEYGSASRKWTQGENDWQANLFGCCSEPCLSKL
ncbi:hypothetical protein Dimus_033408 [Dionaea muscipula]